MEEGRLVVDRLCAGQLRERVELEAPRGALVCAAVEVVAQRERHLQHLLERRRSANLLDGLRGGVDATRTCHRRATPRLAVGDRRGARAKMCAEAFARSAEILPRCSEASASLRCAEDVPRLCRGAPKCAEVRRGAPRCEAGLRDERDRLGDLGDLLVEGGADEHALDPQLVPRNLLHAQRVRRRRPRHSAGSWHRGSFPTARMNFSACERCEERCEVHETS